jgi:D-alanyl-D-alanine carboxypeptidase
MTDFETTLNDLLTAAVAGRGVASASLVPHAGAEPETVWFPASKDEPAFLAYSITKILLSVLVLRLCERGRMSLDDQVVRWFPRIASAERMSVRQLLNHTAGIPDYGGTRAYHDDVRAAPSRPWSFERFAAETFERGLSFEPGQGWRYSNPGYMLVKRIVEAVGGDSLRGLVADHIAGSLGLQRTVVAESLEDLASLAPGTSRLLSTNADPRDVRAHYHPGWVSHGVVASTSSDLARFLDRLFAGALLSASSLQQMTTLVPVPVEPPPHGGRPGYGLGLMGDQSSPLGLLLGHNGGGPCYGASAFHNKRTGASACVMGAIEDDFRPQEVVVTILARLGPIPAQ